MADLGSNNWLVSPTHEVEQKWIAVQIQERKSQIVKLKQDIEDLIKGRQVALEAKILMLESEVIELENKKVIQ